MVIIIKKYKYFRCFAEMHYRLIARRIANKLLKQKINYSVGDINRDTIDIMVNGECVYKLMSLSTFAVKMVCSLIMYYFFKKIKNNEYIINRKTAMYYHAYEMVNNKYLSNIINNDPENFERLLNQISTTGEMCCLQFPEQKSRVMFSANIVTNNLDKLDITDEIKARLYISLICGGK